MTFEEVQELIAKPKKLVAEDGHLRDSYYLDQTVPLNLTLELTDTETQKLKFRLAINQSSKIGYKISFHLMDSNGYVALSRLDIKGSHWNPKEVTDKVPDFLVPHASEQILTSHLHYFVEGYERLAWALPLADVNDDRLKDISSTSSNVHVDIVNTLLGYLAYLNVGTKFTINTIML